MDFPPNSKKAQEAAARERDKRVKRVTSADPVRRRKPLGKQFKETFFSGTATMAKEYVVDNVIIPMFRDMMAEAIHGAFDRLIFGESRRRRHFPGPPSGPTGTVRYDMQARAYDDRPPAARMNTVSRTARARGNFDEIILTSRSEAEEVLEQLFELISRYGETSVADLYELTGVESAHTDTKWGWHDLRGSNVQRLRSGGYLLNLPQPEEL